MLVENYSNSRSRQTHSAVEAIFSDLRVDNSIIKTPRGVPMKHARDLPLHRLRDKRIS